MELIKIYKNFVWSIGVLAFAVIPLSAQIQITEKDIKEIRILAAEKNSLTDQVKELKGFLEEFKQLINQWKEAYELSVKEIELHKQKNINNGKIIELQEKKINKLSSQLRKTKLIGAISTALPLIGIVLLLL
jgi:biopolymer transport protein ExbB/TolQ